jgi:hypothetical protein
MFALGFLVVAYSGSAPRLPLHARGTSAVVGMSAASRRLMLQTATLAVAGVALAPNPAESIGPINVELVVKRYTEVDCPPELAAGRIGGALGAAASKGVKQRCIRVEVTGVNPGKATLIDSAVFGRVFNDQGNSIVANNQDGRTDAGQFAMIPKIVPGQSDFDFIFVSTDSRGTQFGTLKFESLKAISYPGGERYKVYNPCEQNPAMEGCGMDD